MHTILWCSLLPAVVGQSDWAAHSTDTQADWQASFDGTTGNISFNTAYSFPTPLKVRHADGCSAPPTLALQMDTAVEGTLTVDGVDIGAMVQLLMRPKTIHVLRDTISTPRPMKIGNGTDARKVPVSAPSRGPAVVA